MKRRLYYVLPDVASAERAVRDLLLARIEYRRIHCLARRGTDLGSLPEAGFMQKTDVVHGAEIGIIIGGACGILGGTLILLFPPEGITLQLVTVLITGVAGALFGMWVASMAGTAIPNSRLADFERDIEQGRILLMVDVPFTRTQEISDLLGQRHPEGKPGGTEPTIPAFP